MPNDQPIRRRMRGERAYGARKWLMGELQRNGDALVALVDDAIQRRRKFRLVRHCEGDGRLKFSAVEPFLRRRVGGPRLSPAAVSAAINKDTAATTQYSFMKPSPDCRARLGIPQPLSQASRVED
jgi:hypothetical protein